MLHLDPPLAPPLETNHEADHVVEAAFARDRPYRGLPTAPALGRRRSRRSKAIDATSKTQRLELPDDTTAIGTRDRRVRRPRCRALH